MSFEKLPSGYTRCEYLQSQGNQWIDTGVCADPNMTFKLVFSYSKLGWYCIAGVEDHNEEYNLRITLKIDTKALGWNHHDTELKYGKVYTAEVIDQKNYLDGVNITSNWVTLSSCNIYLFCLNRANVACDQSVGVRIYKCECGDLVLVPALDPDGKPCMFDVKAKKAYYNQGTGEFLYKIERDQLPEGYTRCEYLESTGTQYIDTGIVQTEYFSIYTQVSNIVKDQQFNVLFGSSSKYGSNSSKAISVHLRNNSSYFIVNANDNVNVQTSIPVPSGIATISFEVNEQTATLDVNGTSQQFLGIGEERSTATITVFCFHEYGGQTWWTKYRLYCFTMYDKRNIILDLVPCLDPSGTPCMYDLVSKTPFYNQGTGTFKYKLYSGHLGNDVQSLTSLTTSTLASRSKAIQEISKEQNEIYRDSMDLIDSYCGTLLDESEDNTTISMKDIPEKSLKYARLKKLGGNSYVFNQLFKSPDFSDMTNWNLESTTGSSVQTYYTLYQKLDSPESTSSASIYTPVSLIKDHIYLVSIRFNKTWIGSISVLFHDALNDSTYDTGVKTYKYTKAYSQSRLYNIVTCKNTQTYNFTVYPWTDGTTEAGKETWLTRPMLIDLTLMFGYGNEATSLYVTDFSSWSNISQACLNFDLYYFSDDVYPYNTGEIKLATVSTCSIVSHNRYKLANSLLGQVYLDSGMALSSNTKTSARLNNGSGVKIEFQISASATKSYLYFRFPYVRTYIDGLLPSTTWTVSYDLSTNLSDVYFADITAGDAFGYLTSDAGTYTHQDFTSYQHWTKTFDLSASDKEGWWIRLNQVLYFNCKLTDDEFTKFQSEKAYITISNLQVEKGSTATDYVPYETKSYTIPSTIQALTGYGWSAYTYKEYYAQGAGSCRNYIDFENKIYYQCVYKTCFDDYTFSYVSADRRFYFSRSSLGAQYYSKPHGHIQCVRYCHGETYYNYTISRDKTLTTSGLYSGWIRDDSYTDADTLKTSLTGVELYYELATPIVTDISDLLDDNMILVDPNGLITFETSGNGNLKVPPVSEISFITKS